MVLPAFLPTPLPSARLGIAGSLPQPRPHPRCARARLSPRCRLQLQTIREHAATLNLTLVQGGIGPFITFDALYTPPPPPANETSGAREGIESALPPAPPPPRRLASVTGYTLMPLARRVHLDSLRGAPLPTSAGAASPTSLSGDDAAATPLSGGLRGLTPSQLVVGALLAVAADKGATTAVALAINDGDAQHATLTKWMIRNGAAPLRTVGDGWRDVPDRLVWGGRGELVGGAVDDILALGERLIVAAQRRRQRRASGGGTEREEGGL
ncbi:hypothetical protein MMPV_009029 [Pyropia vietnamensis]